MNSQCSGQSVSPLRAAAQVVVRCKAKQRPKTSPLED